MRKNTDIERIITSLLGLHRLHSLVSNAGVIQSPKDLYTRIEYVITPKIEEMSVEKLGEIINYSNTAFRGDILPWGGYEATFDPNDSEEMGRLFLSLAQGGKSILIHLACMTITVIAYELIKHDAHVMSLKHEIRFTDELADYMDTWIKNPNTLITSLNGDKFWCDCHPRDILQIGSGVYAVRDSWGVVDIFFDAIVWNCPFPTSSRCPGATRVKVVSGSEHGISELIEAKQFVIKHFVAKESQTVFWSDGKGFPATLRWLAAIRHE